VAEWESAEHVAQGHDDGFRQLLSGPQWSAFRSTPALYEVVHMGAHPTDTLQ